MPTPIRFPGNFAPGLAVSYSGAEGAVLVSQASPLPVAVAAGGAAAPAPLAGTASTSGNLGPFAPVSGRAVMLALSGTWAGTVRVMRSTDGGTTLLPLTVGGADWAVYAGNACEAVWEEAEAGATLWLTVALTSGAVTYRMAQ